MWNIKYQLIPTEAAWPSDRTVINKFLKICVICGILMLMLYYSLSSSVGTEPAQVYSNPSWIGFTPNQPEEGFKLEATALRASRIIPIIPARSTARTIQGESLGPNILEDYYVFTSKCRMPALDPFAKDAMLIFKKSNYSDCDSSKALLAVSYNEEDRRYRLNVTQPNVKCCYKRILRDGTGTQADMKFKLSSCQYFLQDILVPLDVDAVITECRRLKNRKVLQHDAFTFVQPEKHVPKAKSKVNASPKRRPSLLLWGIDSLSRMNFQRTMPLMAQYLRKENWFELQGYNKMGDNTFPNLMALLTGFNNSLSYSVCQPCRVGGLDACPFVWQNYHDQGYVTAYAEDWMRFSTFNFRKYGFAKPPTDYYPRPFLLAMEKQLRKVLDTGIPFCLGRRHYAEYVYDFAVQFHKVHRSDSTFGMFWANTFSHNNFALPSAMDGRMLAYMRTLQSHGVFENSIVVFFSDHGMRFGSLRRLDSGFLEERMPIMYIWLPKWFRATYPKFADALRLNRNRLTSPYDIYATLRHILELDTTREQLPRPVSCARCHSLFYEVDEARDCQDAGIDSHWCTCHTFLNNSRSDAHIKDIAQQLVNATNLYLEANNLTELCHPLTLSSIVSVQRKIHLMPKTVDSYLVKYYAQPQNCLFEASVDWNNKTKHISTNVPDISRLTSYNAISECIEDVIAKKYCVCRDYVAPEVPVTSVV